MIAICDGSSSGTACRPEYHASIGGSHRGCASTTRICPSDARDEEREQDDQKRHGHPPLEYAHVPGLQNRDHYPALVIGTGIAGLTTAFTLANAGIRVLLVTKATDPADCNTSWAQGGIIYQGENDTPAKLIDDIIRAGAGISNEEAVHFLAEEGPQVVKQLLLDEIHVPFSTTVRGRARSDAGRRALGLAHHPRRRRHGPGHRDVAAQSREVGAEHHPGHRRHGHRPADDAPPSDRHPGALPADERMRRRVSARQQDQRRLHDLRRLHGAGHGRHRADLPAHDEHAQLPRRRRGHGQPRRRADHERGVRAVPSDGAGGQEGQSLPDLRGAAGRGGAAQEPARRILHGDATRRS